MPYSTARKILALLPTGAVKDPRVTAPLHDLLHFGKENVGVLPPATVDEEGTTEPGGGEAELVAGDMCRHRKYDEFNPWGGKKDQLRSIEFLSPRRHGIPNSDLRTAANLQTHSRWPPSSRTKGMANSMATATTFKNRGTPNSVHTKKRGI